MKKTVMVTFVLLGIGLLGCSKDNVPAKVVSQTSTDEYNELEVAPVIILEEGSGEALSVELQGVFNDSVEALENQSKSKNFNGESYGEILKRIPRSERKEVCLEIMNHYRNKDPQIAYYGASCLLFNGYGKFAVPLFAEFSVNGNNEKYLNGRMGYDWLHAGDWYGVGEKIFTDMTGGQELFVWVQDAIQQELLNNSEKYKKYGIDPVAQVLTERLKEQMVETPLSEREEEQLEKCDSIMININSYRCNFDKENKSLKNCKKEAVMGHDLIECKKNKSAMSPVSTNSNTAFYPINKLKQNNPTTGIYNTEGFVVKIYTCPTCPKGAQCKPCMQDNIVISMDNTRLESYSLTEKELLIFTKTPDHFELGKKYDFTLRVLAGKTTGEPINDIELIGYRPIQD